MKELIRLFESNRAWAAATTARDPEFFEKLKNQQAPEYLWIGCADSRVPATEICGLLPGEIFVHRNVANLIVHTDMNMLSVLQYAVDVLRVRHVIVCGHYGCGGVAAALAGSRNGLIDNWLRNIKDVAEHHKAELDRRRDPGARARLLCELNVGAQVANLCYTNIIQDAWARDQPVTIHGWIYGLEDGLLRDLDLCVSEIGQLPAVYRLDG